MKRSQKAVQHTLTTYLFETFQGRNPRREYQQKTNKREDRYIDRAIKQNPFTPFKNITNIIGPKLSTSTLRHQRSESGLSIYFAAET